MEVEDGQHWFVPSTLVVAAFSERPCPPVMITEEEMVLSEGTDIVINVVELMGISTLLGDRLLAYWVWYNAFEGEVSISSLEITREARRGCL